jgi:hypothetical protein
MITDIDTTLSVAGAALGFLALVYSLYAIRDARRWRERFQALEFSLQALQREEFELAVKAGRTAERVEREFSLVADRLEQLEIRGPAESLDRAIDSARLGATPGTLAHQFGLSPIEAELVTRIHGHRKSA